MFQDKSFKKNYITSAIMPWLVCIPGLLAIVFFQKESDYFMAGLLEKSNRAGQLFECFYFCTMVLGVILVVVLGVRGLVSLLDAFHSTKEKYSAARPLVNWIWSGVCSLVTLLLMLLIHAFTYGMSV